MTPSVCANLLASILSATVADEDTVRKAFEGRFPQAQVQSLSKTPVPGLYEVYANGAIVYVDEEVHHVFEGSLSDVHSQRNLTADSMARLSAIPFDKLPLDLAVKVVKGKGERQLALFADPDCSFCRQLEVELAKLDDVTIHVFLMPAEESHPGATEKSRRVWCSADRAGAWEKAVRGEEAPAGAGDCDAPFAQVIDLARSYRIQETPTLVFADGRRVAGTLSAENLEAALNASSKNDPEPAAAPEPQPAAEPAPESPPDPPRQ